MSVLKHYKKFGILQNKLNIVITPASRKPHIEKGLYFFHRSEVRKLKLKKKKAVIFNDFTSDIL